MFENFNFEISKIFKTAENIRDELNHSYVGSEHLLLAIMKEDMSMSKLLRKYNLTYSNFKKELKKVVDSTSKKINMNLYTPLLKRIIESASDKCQKDNSILNSQKLILEMLEYGEGIALRVLILMDIDIEKLYSELKQYGKNKDLKIEFGKILNDNVNLKEKVFCRDEEIDMIIETLLRHKKNNPLLVGKAGVGKTAIVEELTRRIITHKVPNELINKKIVMLEMGSLVAGTKYRGDFEDKLNKIINSVLENKDIILFIDEVHSMVSAGAADGAISASDILKPYLARGDIKVIGATTTSEYNKYFVKDKALTRRFEKIFIEEPSVEQTKVILKGVKKEYEQYHNVKISSSNIDKIVNLSNKYIFDKCNPDKSIEMLDTICAKVKLKNKNIKFNNNNIENLINKKNNYIKCNNFDKALELKKMENKYKNNIDNDNVKTITTDDILEFIASKTKIPILNKTKCIDDIKRELNKNVYGQGEAVDKIIKLLSNKKDCLKSILFYGPSGVGKTYTAKVIGKKINFIQLNMNEFSKEGTINKLIKLEDGYSDNYIFSEIKEKPYTLILIDEIEKAHPKVISLLTKIIDDKSIKDFNNEIINFNNCIIIATTNVKASNPLGFSNINKNYFKNFPKSLLSKFDDVIEFNHISLNDIYFFLNKKTGYSKKTQDNIANKIDWFNNGFKDIVKELNMN